jgi:hypothetical protein
MELTGFALIGKHLHLALKELDEVTELFNTSKYAFKMTNESIWLFKQFNCDSSVGEDIPSKMHTKYSRLAKEEIDKQFITLGNHYVVMLYATMEANIKRVIVELLKQFSNIAMESLEKLKLPGKILFLDEDERFDILFFEYEKAIAIGSNYSVDRFEKLLKPFNLDGAVDKKVSKFILELSQIRNILLHKAGRVDSHFLKLVPWLNLKLNDKLILDGRSFSIYDSAVNAYFLTIMLRLDIYNDEGKELLSQNLQKYLGRLS